MLCLDMWGRASAIQKLFGQKRLPRFIRAKIIEGNSAVFGKRFLSQNRIYNIES